MRSLAAAGLLLTSCGPPPCYVPDGRYEMVDLPVSVTRTSDLGFSVDDPKEEIDPVLLDRTVQNTLECLRALDPLTMEERMAASCGGSWDLELRSCLVVKDAPSWHVSACTGNEIFSCDAPTESCLAKGQTPTEACPCSCRAAVEHDGTIVTAPNLELLPWRLTELLTGCDHIEYVPRLSACGSPDLRFR